MAGHGGDHRAGFLRRHFAGEQFARVEAAGGDHSEHGGEFGHRHAVAAEELDLFVGDQVDGYRKVALGGAGGDADLEVAAALPQLSFCLEPLVCVIL